MARANLKSMVIALAIGSIFLVHDTAAAAEECKDVLIKKSVNYSMSQSAIQYMLRFVNDQNYEETSHGGGASIPGFFDGKYSDFEKKRREHTSQEVSHLSNDQAFSAFMIEVPSEAINAWRDCMLRQGANAVGYIRGALDGTVFRFVISWRPPEGYEQTPLSISDVQLIPDPTNGTSGTVSWTSALPPQLVGPGDYVFQIKRSANNVPVTGSLNAKWGATTTPNRAIDFYIPAFVAPPTSMNPDPIHLGEHPELCLGAEQVHGGLSFDDVYWSNDVKVGTFSVLHSIGLHPPAGRVKAAENSSKLRANARFAIPPHAKYFLWSAGLANGPDGKVVPKKAAVIFRVYVDGNPTAVQAETVNGGGQLKGQFMCPIPDGAKELKLETESHSPIDPPSSHLYNGWACNAVFIDPFFTGHKP